MKRKRKTEIIVERDQVLVIKRLEKRGPQWCEQCAGQSQMVSVDEAAAIVRVSSRAVYQQVEAGQVHFAEPPDGQLHICLASLLNPTRIETKKQQ